ncbi:MAG: glycosyltransferase [Deltaproteobacteria bacterium]|nr:glycosyltransferase [Deltaproteobacteria bacterium]
MAVKKRPVAGPLATFFRLKNRARSSYFHYKRRLSFFVRTMQKAFTGSSAGFSRPTAAHAGVAAEELFQTELELFLASGATLAVKPCIAPAVSIVLVLHNRAELTYKCLTSLFTITTSYELIIVDNASTDATGRLLDALVGAKVVRNSENVHFLRAVNQAAELASGTYLLFLNNDARLLPGALDSAVDLIEADPAIGAVGAQVVRLDGTLQEAGSIIWKDGSCQGYGRDENPRNSEYMFQRDVDYCSGVFLLTSRALFLENGGFDPVFAPAYYEETDYCMRLRARGKRIVYNPGSVVLHVEFASSNSPAEALALQKKHREIFRARHAAALAGHCERGAMNILTASCAQRGAQRVLHIDDCVPHAYLGSGYPRSRDMLEALDALGFGVTFYPLLTLPETWDDVYSDIPRTIEVVAEGGFDRLETFLKTRAGYYTTMIVSRPHNMWIVKKILSRSPDVLAGAQLVYDAEAVFCLRDINKSAVQGKSLSRTEQAVVLEEELKPARDADCVVTVSAIEQRMFAEHGCTNVRILGHSVEPAMTPHAFSARRDFLFAGAFPTMDSPNTDSMVWFVEEILPRISARLNQPFKFIIAGHNSQKHLRGLQSQTVDVLGPVDDLTPLYNDCRVFIVPTRYAAGIPYKAHHAAAHGIPLVATGLIAAQLGWVHEQDLLVADSPEDFAEQCVRLYTDEALWNRLRTSAAERIQKECSRAAFIENVRAIIK